MPLFNRDREREPRGVLGDQCDRCGGGGRVRVGKDLVVELTEPVYPDAPLHLDTQRLDLVFCATHFNMHEPSLRQQRWMTLDDRR